MSSNIYQSSKFLIVILLIASIMMAHATEANSVAEAIGRELRGRRMPTPPPSPALNGRRQHPHPRFPPPAPGPSPTPL